MLDDRVGSTAADDAFGDLLWRYPLTRWRRLEAYETGFVVTRRMGRDRRHRWSQVRELSTALTFRYDHEVELGSVAHQMSWTLRLRLPGRLTMQLWAPLTRTLASDFFRRGPRDLGEQPQGALYEDLAGRVADTQLPAAVEAARSGEQVRFGPVTAAADGLHAPDGQVLPWPKVASVEYVIPLSARPRQSWTTGAIFTGQAVIEARDQDDPDDTGQTWFQAPDVTMPNLHTLARLADVMRDTSA
ncbi:hypothetical protein O7632_18145 [Solwaraspora sp. WMMD406]|uniref:hypothetical protein n=1 Tax=Solwaraspora sp. WMMD406 TaxID=3016095 RepID=UPI002417BC5A|nr:hypothetical protein [Solwaraspora sp. WMMD406]MDG4766007.1 hypothetical protein [Solwaraspora sp. WMMD406]